jgi:uncharacterized protein (TIGR02118 family)
MFKNIGLQVRKAGMDHGAFMQHWLAVHAPLSTRVAGVRGYVVNEILAQLDSGSALLAVTPPLDGIAHLWFDSREAMVAMSQTAEAKRWFGDGVNYLGARTALATSERAVLPLKATSDAAKRLRFKLIRLLRQDPARSAAHFQQRWHGAYAAQLSALSGLRGFVQSIVSAVNPDTNMPPIEVGVVSGVDELWFDSESAATAAARTLAAPTAPVASVFCSATCTWLAQETTIIAPPQLIA